MEKGTSQIMINKDHEEKIRELRILELQRGNDGSLSWLINKYLRIGIIAWVDGKTLPVKNRSKNYVKNSRRILVYKDVFESICYFRAFYMIKKRKMPEVEAADRLFRLGFEWRHEYSEDSFNDGCIMKNKLKELIDTL